MKKMYLLRFIAFTLIVTCFGNAAIADVIQKKDTVSGIVIDKKKQPLPGAKVEIMGQSYSAFTDIDGRFSIKCDPGAKKVLVTYPKLKAAKKKIKPDMTVQIGRSWKQVPEHYQWFVGANIGVGYTYFEDYSGYNDNPYDFDADFLSPTISIMVGRVKAVGWYLKAFINPSVKPNDFSNYDSPYYDDANPSYRYYVIQSDSKCFNSGLILGGMVRLGCPLHLYLGGGFAYTDLTTGNPYYRYHKYSWQIDMGFLFRIKDNFGINWSMNLGDNDTYSYGSFTNLGVSYFFNK
ncbi:MAG: carboxypeptidase-like regulatory domain-containing protein [Muribaculaceae bacterium]|nr:carboxypeptidase-like regulatory domain-containing protein [Muribaculaceae bacterium]